MTDEKKPKKTVSGENAGNKAPIEEVQQAKLLLSRAREARGSSDARVAEEDALKLLIDVENRQGPSSEVCSLIGRIHRERWRDALGRDRESEAGVHLSRAIDAYIRAFDADLSDVYSGVSALSLLDHRGDADSLALRDQYLPVVKHMLKRQSRGEVRDYWEHATNLELAVLASDEKEAQRHAQRVLKATGESWLLQTTVENLRRMAAARCERGAPVEMIESVIDTLERKSSRPTFPSRSPDPAEPLSSARALRVFISSTYLDLVDHRARAAEAVDRLGQHGVRMEVFGSRPADATEASLGEVRESDLFVGIYAHRYGCVPSGSEESITKMEFDHARELGKPIFCFLVDEDHPWPPKHMEREPGRSSLESFKELIRSSLVHDSFTTPEDLAFKMAASLGRFLITQKVKLELTQAAQKEPEITEQMLDQVARRAERLYPIVQGARVLLVNDVPAEMRHVVRILRDIEVEVETATNSDDAIERLSSQSFDAVVSDMARDGVQDEGLKFLERMRKGGLHHPTVFTVAQYEPARGTPAYAFGITNRVDDLLNFLFDIFDRVRG